MAHARRDRSYHGASCAGCGSGRRRNFAQGFWQRSCLFGGDDFVLHGICRRELINRERRGILIKFHSAPSAKTSASSALSSLSCVSESRLVNKIADSSLGYLRLASSPLPP